MAQGSRVPRPKPGLAFSLVSDLGFAVGLVTHDGPRIGSLVWIAAPTFEEEPTVEVVQAIERWRWCVFFPLGAALHRKIVTPIGVVTIPRALEPFPLMRGGNKKRGWRMVQFVGSSTKPLGAATDPAAPIYQLVKDTRLKEMIVSGWASQ